MSFRLVFATLLMSSAIVLGLNLVGSGLDEKRVNTPWQEAVIHDLELLATKISDKYKTPPPEILFVESQVAGVTVTPQAEETGQRSRIHLGSPVQTKAFVEEIDLLKSVVAHETGHSILHAKNKNFPLLWILGIYFVPTWFMLSGFPTIRGICTVGVLLFMALSAMSMVTPTLDASFRKVIYLWFGLSIFTAIVGRDLANHFPRAAALVGGHIPTRTFMLSTAFLALLSYFLIGAKVGELNVEREILCDTIAACEADPSALATALKLMNAQGERSSHPAWVGQLLDPFHPPLAQRIERLNSMSNEVFRREECFKIEQMLLTSSPGNIRWTGILVEPQPSEAPKAG